MLPWLGAGILVVAAVIFLPKVFGGDDEPAAGSTSTTAAVSTTGADTTTTAATTTTSATTTTAAPTTSTTEATTTSAGTPGAVIEDHFEGSTTGIPVFGPEFMTFGVVTEFGRGEITSTAGGGILPIYYEPPVGDVQVDLWVRAFPANPDAGIVALMVLAEDPVGGVEHYVLVWLDLNNRLVNVAKFIGGGWGEVTSAAIPSEAGFDPEQGNLMRAFVAGGALEVFINDTFVVSWDDGFPFTTGYVGPTLLATGAGDRLRIDDFVVLPISE